MNISNEKEHLIARFNVLVELEQAYTKNAELEQKINDITNMYESKIKELEEINKEIIDKKEILEKEVYKKEVADDEEELPGNIDWDKYVQWH